MEPDPETIRLSKVNGKLRTQVADLESANDEWTKFYRVNGEPDDVEDEEEEEEE